MCGRVFISESKALAAQAGVAYKEAGREEDTNRPPGSEMPVILDARPGQLHYVQWGLIPAGAAQRPDYNTFYARIETMHERPAYSTLPGRRHCVFVINGFYEWCTQCTDRQPWYFKRADDGLIYCAGLWDTWHDKQRDITIVSSTMIMQPSNAYMGQVHDRMPCILDAAESGVWLNRELPLPERLKVLKPMAEDLLTGWPVGKQVNNAAHKGTELMKPVPRNKTLFD